MTSRFMLIFAAISGFIFVALGAFGAHVLSQSLGAAEMAWSILAGRDHRASKEMAYHVFETMHGIMMSAETGSFYQLQSTFQTPAALPAGYRSVGDWSRKEESALI